MIDLAGLVDILKYDQMVCIFSKSGKFLYKGISLELYRDEDNRKLLSYSVYAVTFGEVVKIIVTKVKKQKELIPC